METVNQKHKVKATVISPLSIGQSSEKDWVEGIDYIRADNTLYHLNMQLMADSDISMEKLSALYASGETNKIKDYLQGKLKEIHDFSMNMPISSVNPVKTFYFNPITAKYVLSGSSLKGAIRSAVFHSLVQNEAIDELHRKGNGLDRYVFGDIADGTNFMRFIRIGDFDFEKTELINTKIYNLWKDHAGNKWQGGWKHKKADTNCSFNDVGFNTIYECLMPRAEAYGFIMVSSLLYSNISAQMRFKEEKDRIMRGSPIHRLFSVVNEATLSYLEKEIRFFEAYPQGRYSERIIASLKHYHELASTLSASNGNDCLVKMSAGTGFHSITGDWQYDDYTKTGCDYQTGKKRFKSRKIACFNGQFTPMGFLKLQIVE